MAGILIIAHAPFATALRDCISHIYGGLPARIGVIDVSPDCDPAQQVAFAHSEIERLKEENGALVLTDMFGATPANIAGRLASVPNVRVLCGVNLPILVRAVCYRATPLDTLVDTATMGELDALTIRRNAAREAYDYETQGVNYRSDATLSRMNASAAKTGGYLGAAGTILGGGAEAYKTYKSSLIA